MFYVLIRTNSPGRHKARCLLAVSHDPVMHVQRLNRRKMESARGRMAEMQVWRLHAWVGPFASRHEANQFKGRWSKTGAGVADRVAAAPPLVQEAGKQLHVVSREDSHLVP